MTILPRFGSSSQALRRRMIAGFAVVAALCLLISVISYHALRTVIQAKDRVISDYAHNLLTVRELELSCEQQVSSSRAYLLTRDPDFQAKALRSRHAFQEGAAALRARIEEGERGSLDRVIAAEQAHWDAMGRAIADTAGNRDLPRLSEYFEQLVLPRREELREAFHHLIDTEERQLEAVLHESSRAASRMSLLVLGIAVPAVVAAAGLFARGRRTLGRLALAEQEVHDLNRTLEGRVAERTAELSRTVRELEGFAYTVAHDLRAPLRAMSGLSQMTLEDFGRTIPQAGHDYLKRIDASARRMDDLIIGLLDYSRLSYSEVELNAVDLDGLARSVVEAFGTEIHRKGALVEVKEPLGRVLANAAMLRQVLDNLFSNAIKFVAPGVAPRIRIWSEEDSGRLRLWVTDNGIGIPAEHRERIFGVFQRLHRAEEYPGTGIGLAIVRKAVERMGGRVGAESQPGEGSRFWVDLRAA